MECGASLYRYHRSKIVRVTFFCLILALNNFNEKSKLTKLVLRLCVRCALVATRFTDF